MKNVLIIGATSAIAEQCARLWADRGDAIFLVARDGGRLDTIKGDLKIRGASRVGSFQMDVNNFEIHEEMFAAAENSLGAVDIVLIAHGTLSDQEQCQRDVALTLSEISTNALSVVALLTMISSRFEVRHNGTIAVISSVAGDRGRASNYVYGSAKALVSAFSSGLRQRLHGSGVNIVTVKPGFVDTPMTAEFKKGFLWANSSFVAMKIISAIDSRKGVVYVPSFWGALLFIIKIIPEVVFVRSGPR